VLQNKSSPSLIEFVPLPSQMPVIQYLRSDADYSLGTHEVLLSGSIGSSKSTVLAHMVVTHALMYSGSRVGIGRLALPQLKATLCQKIREHFYGTGVDYKYHETTGDFKIENGSEIKAISWAEGNMAKLGSMEFSAFAIEELTESKDTRAYDTILQRVNRLPHIKEPWVLSACNPDGPSNPFYKRLIASNSPKVKVFYSNTFDNPYLPKEYIEGLLERLDPKMAQRMIYGQWVELDQERIYYAYDQSANFINKSYAIDDRLPIRLAFDFNIGHGKPLSLVFGQYDPLEDIWHWYNQVIIEGTRTLDALEEARDRGLLDHYHFKVHADATGRSRDTRGAQSDIDQIEKFLANLNHNGTRVRVDIEVPRANPRLRDRHNLVNSYCLNAQGRRRLFVYKDAPTVDEGLRLTHLKAGANFIEDDSKSFQHCTTAVGYALNWVEMMRTYGTGPTNIGSF
jgi:hypothetical protein